MKKSLLFLTLSLALVLVLSGCVHQEAPPESDNTVPPTASDDESTAPDEETTPPDEELPPAGDETNVGEPGTPENEPGDTPPPSADDETSIIEPTKKLSMIARQWEFEPSQITASLGDTVILTITSVDVKHGFAIPEFGVNSELNPGEDTEISFKASKAGTFTFRCSVLCGSGHGGMKGTIIVE